MIRQISLSKYEINSSSTPVAVAMINFVPAMFLDTIKFVVKTINMDVFILSPVITPLHFALSSALTHANCQVVDNLENLISNQVIQIFQGK